MEIADLPTKDYKLTWFHAGDYKDPHGNYWCNAAFDGVSEPVRWVVKDPDAVEVNKTYYGHFTKEESKTGKEYIRFRREQKPEESHANQSNSSGNKNNFNPDGQRQGMCLNNATRYVTATAQKTLSPNEFADAVFAYAEALYRKGDLGTANVPEQTELVPEKTPAEEVDEENQEEIAAALKKHVDDDEPINLDDIPF